MEISLGNMDSMTFILMLMIVFGVPLIALCLIGEAIVTVAKLIARVRIAKYRAMGRTNAKESA